MQRITRICDMCKRPKNCGHQLGTDVNGDLFCEYLILINQDKGWIVDEKERSQ